MKKVTVEAPAKINLTLDITGAEGGFHQIKSFVATIDLCDKLTFKKRKDKKVVVHDKGFKCDCPPEKNNAYKTANLFIERFKTDGVDIYIKKKIPVGGGLGGSSADIAGTLNGLASLYNVDADLTDLANELGSDSAYLLKGGFKVISGRGDVIENVGGQKELYLLIISDKQGISAGECYKEYDKLENKELPCTDQAVKLFLDNDEDFYKIIKNDLYAPALKHLSHLENKILDLERAGAIKALMTGSGSCVYGIFLDRLSLEIAKKKLKSKYNKSLIKAKTIII